MAVTTRTRSAFRAPKRLASRYLLATALVAAATLLRVALDPAVEDQVPYFIYVGAVVVATWVAGVGPGLFATVLSAVAGNYFFTTPRFTIAVAAADLAEMAAFAAVGALLVWLVGRWRGAEEQLRHLHGEAEARADELQKVLDTVPAAVFVTRHPDARRMEGNRLAAEYLRLPAGSNLSKTAPPSEQPATFRATRDGVEIPGDQLPVQLALAHGIEVRDCELDVVYDEGSQRTLFGNAVPLTGPDGRVRGAVGAFVDITEKKRATEAMRESELRYSTIFEHAPFAISLTRLSDARIVSVNGAFLRLFEFGREEVLGRTAVELGIADPEAHAQVREAFARDGSLEGFTATRRPRSGELRDLLLYVNPVTLAGEAYLVTIFEDITERKRAEAAVRRSEAQFRSVLDGSRDVIYRMNMPADRYEYISPSAAALVGFSPAELMAMNTEQSMHLVHPDDRPLLAHAVARLAETGREEVEYRQVTKAGDYRWLSNHMALVRDGQGQPLYRDGNIRDVTERRRIEEALQNANRVKDEFLATLSHELRTPLNAILGWSEMLLRPGLPAETQRRALESVNRNARAQAALISDILDVSRIMSGKMRLEVRPVDFSEVLRAACESIQPAADAKGVQVRTMVEGRPVVIGDADRLQQVLWNLLSNAVKFTGPGGHVEVDVRRVESRVEIRVRDNGSGISPAFLPHVFERFRQADASTTRSHTGLGLGLAIVRSLTELHGGTVTAESEGEGRGAAFTVRLPVRAVFATVTEGERIVPEDGAVPAPGDGCLEGVRVVAVDDQEEARGLIQSVLERYGARVIACTSAEQAVEAVRSRPTDVLVADIGMPGIDGYELIRRVRALPDARARLLPAVALTAYDGVNDRANALAAGFWLHLAKPIRPDALVSAVAAVAGAAAGRHS